MGRGDNLQIHARGMIVMSGPEDSERAARGVLETKLRILFADLADPLVCPQFAKTGIAVQYAGQLAQAPWIRYVSVKAKVPKVLKTKFVVPAASARRLQELEVIVKKSRGAKRIQAQHEQRGVALAVAYAQQAHEAKQAEREIAIPAPIRVEIQSLDVKYRNPPNAQWKWWARVRDEQNTIRPGTYTGGP